MSDIEVQNLHHGDEFNRHLEKRRWLILTVFTVFTFSNASGFITYSPILEESKKFYNVDEQAILWFANCYYLLYVVLAVPTLYFFRWRLDYSLMIGTFLNGMGGWIRYFGNDSYLYAILGQTVLSFAQLFILPAPVFIAERWFGMAERVTATGIMIFGNVLGISFGFLTSVYYVTDASKLHNYTFYMAIVLSLAFIPGLFIFRDKPKYAASSSSQNTHKIDVMVTIRMIFTKAKSLLITISLSLYLGMSWTIISVIDVLLENYGNDQIALIGLYMNATGTISGILTTYLVDKALQKGGKPNYDRYLRLFATISVVSLVVFSVMLQLDLQDDYKLVVYIICAFIGMGFQAFIPIAAQSFLENLYPMHEVACFTSFNIFANLLGFIGNMLTSINGLGTAGAWILVGMMIPIYTDPVRYTYEMKHDHLREADEQDISDESVENKNNSTTLSHSSSAYEAFK